jgi:hypothetical protein
MIILPCYSFSTNDINLLVKDNAGILISHMSRQMGVPPSELRGMAGIAEDFEDIS